MFSTYDPDTLDRRDPRFIERVLPVVEWFDAHYLRLVVEGEAHLRPRPALYVANHNGGIMGPDLFCTLAVLWRQLGPRTPLYALAHDFAMRQLTPLGRLLQRVGAIRASRSNAARVFDRGGSVLVYPGGDLDAYRHSSRRDEVILLPRTGFVEVARRAGVPVVPIVAQGAHRSAFIFSEGKRIARRLRMAHWGRLQRFPLALALPWIVAPGPWLPYLPLPFRVQLRILPPMAVEDGSVHDAALRVQTAMQRALDAMVP